MTLDEAIKHAEEAAIEQDKLCKRYDDASGYSRSHNEAVRTTDAKRCEECAKEHRQLAEWLRELKQLKEQKFYVTTRKLSDDELKHLEEQMKKERWQLISVKQDPCEDAISRQDAIDCLTATGLKKFDFILDARDKIKNLPSVTPQYTDAEIQKIQELEQAEIEKAYELGEASQPKTGHWIRWYERKEYDWGIDNIPHCKCSECGKEYDPHSSQFIKYCCECGVKMAESEE